MRPPPATAASAICSAHSLPIKLAAKCPSLGLTAMSPDVQNRPLRHLRLIPLWQTSTMVSTTAARQALKKHSGQESPARAKAAQRSRERAASAPGGKSNKTVPQGWVIEPSGSKSKELAKVAPAKAAYKAAARARSQDSSIEARRISASSPDQVIALMKSAGILNAAGKLTRSFR